jgi:hypothetical protein
MIYTFNADAAGESPSTPLPGMTFNNMGVSGDNYCAGSQAYSSATTNGFYKSPASGANTRFYRVLTPAIPATVSDLNVVEIGIKYKIELPDTTGSDAWTIRVIFRNITTPSDLVLGTITGNGTVGCTNWYFAPLVGGAALTLGNNYRIVVEAETANTDMSTNNYVTIDDIFTNISLLSSDSDTGSGLSEPSFTKNTATGAIGATPATLKADITLTKSAQSSVSCGNSSSTGQTANCSLGSVKGNYVIYRKNKSTGAEDVSHSETFTITYGSGSSTVLSKSDAVFEDATYTYKHVAGYQAWHTNGVQLVWKFVKFDAPVWPTKNLNFNMGFLNNSGLDCDGKYELRQMVDGSTYSWIDQFVADSTNWGDATDLNMEKGYIAQIKPIVAPSDIGQSVVISWYKKDAVNGNTLDSGTVDNNTGFEINYDEILDGYEYQFQISVDLA